MLFRPLLLFGLVTQLAVQASDAPDLIPDEIPDEIPGDVPGDPDPSDAAPGDASPADPNPADPNPGDDPSPDDPGAADPNEQPPDETPGGESPDDAPSTPAPVGVDPDDPDTRVVLPGESGDYDPWGCPICAEGSTFCGIETTWVPEPSNPYGGECVGDEPPYGDTYCGIGTQWVTDSPNTWDNENYKWVGECVEDCPPPEPEEFCGENTEWNEKKQQCFVISDLGKQYCLDGTIWNEEENECQEDKTIGDQYCGESTYWDADYKLCRHPDMDWPPYKEGSRINGFDIVPQSPMTGWRSMAEGAGWQSRTGITYGQFQGGKRTGKILRFEIWWHCRNYCMEQKSARGYEFRSQSTSYNCYCYKSYKKINICTRQIGKFT